MSIKDTVLKTNPDLTQIIRKAVDRIGENHTLARDNKGVTYSASEVEKDRKQQQSMFLQSRMAQMAEMLSMIAHQWKQPLSAISSVSTIRITIS